ncbi:MAG: hypothetical protein GY868_21765, partial [Deltaproteobacteria bacterium]|nr:hypothetical protein [Deltaproteobacteria bacterium]
MKKTSLWSKPALKVRIVFILLLGLGSVQLGAEVSEAADFLRKHDVAFDLFVNDRFHAFHNFHDTGNSEFNHDRSLHVLYVNPAVSIRLAPGLLGFFELESQFIYDFDDEESADDQETRNAYLKALVPGMNWMTISAGRQSLSTLDGFIYDGEAPAFRLQADFERGLGLPLKLDSVIAGVERDSPYLQADLTYNYAFLESLTFSYGWFRDTDDGIAVIFNELDSETSYRSRSQFHWFGASLKMFLDDFFLRTSFVYERGTIRLREGDPGSRSMAVHAYLADVNLDYYFTSHLWFSFFVFVASGDDRPLQGTLRSFISIDPFIDKTSIFFNGG